MSKPSTFPSLLRKTQFASFDPLIHRVYTTPNSSAAKGDWGLKYTLPPSKRDRARYRNIKVLSLDAGQGLGCDYRSGEREGRFMERWGNGRFGWSADDGMSGSSSMYEEFVEAKPNKTLRERYASGSDGTIGTEVLTARPRRLKDETVSIGKPLVDIEYMSEERFQRYLEEVRSRRASMLSWKRKAHSAQQAASAESPTTSAKPSSSSSSTPSEPPTSLFKDALEGKSSNAIVSNFLSHDFQRTLRKGSHLLPAQHSLGGLAYANFGKESIKGSHPLLNMPGRVVDRLKREESSPYGSNKSAREDTSRISSKDMPYVVSLGGLTAKMNPQNSGGLEVPTYEKLPTGEVSLEGTSSTFRVDSAKVQRLPTVVSESASTGKASLTPTSFNQRFSQNAGSKGVSALDDFKFSVFAENSSGRDAEWVRENEGALIPGEKGWIAAQGRAVDAPASDDFMKRGLDMGRRSSAMEDEYRRKGSYAGGSSVNPDMLKSILGEMGGAKRDSRANKPGYSFTASRRSAPLDLSGRPQQGRAVQAKPEAKPEEVKEEVVEKPGDDIAKGGWREIEEDLPEPEAEAVGKQK